MKNFWNYVKWGGLPNRCDFDDEDNIKNYLHSVFDSIILRNVIKRLNLKDTILFTTKDDDNLLSIFKYSFGYTKPEILKLPEDNWFINKINVENEKVTIYTSRFMEGKGFLDYKNEVFVNIVKCKAIIFVNSASV